jgi:hypothetical protein
MKFYKRILYEKISAEGIKELKRRLNNILIFDKYEGYWENNNLYLKKMAFNPNKIMPEIHVEIVDKVTERVISVEFVIRRKFEKFIRVILFLLSLFEILIIYSIIKSDRFSIIIFVPFILGFFIYLITYLSYKLECDDFRNDLNNIIH